MGACHSPSPNLVPMEQHMPPRKDDEAKVFCDGPSLDAQPNMLLPADSTHEARLFLQNKNITETICRLLFFEAAVEEIGSGNSLLTVPQAPLTYLDWWLTSDSCIAQTSQRILYDLLHPISVSNIQSVESFQSFVSKHPEWQTSRNCFVFFRDHPKVQGKLGVLIQRAQTNPNNCFIHAPIVTHHYAMCLHEPQPVTIDISSFVLDHLKPAKVLAKLLFNVGGSSSKSLLIDLLDNSSLDATNSFDRMQQNLVLYGPGLVSTFRVDKKFHTSEQTVYHGLASGSQASQHAMVLVGCRKDRCGNEFLLFQNWSKQKQWIECDPTYLRSSFATVYFITKKVNVPKKFNVTSQFYAETNIQGNDFGPEEF